MLNIRPNRHDSSNWLGPTNSSKSHTHVVTLQQEMCVLHQIVMSTIFLVWKVNKDLQISAAVAFVVCHWRCQSEKQSPPSRYPLRVWHTVGKALCQSQHFIRALWLEWKVASSNKSQQQAARQHGFSRGALQYFKRVAVSHWGLMKALHGLRLLLIPLYSW